MNRLSLGKRGEELALEVAQAQGYRLLEANYRCPLGEIDLILEKGETVAFVEVKTRRGETYGEAWEAVTPAKQERIRRVAAWYVRERGLAAINFRLDVFTVSLDRGRRYRWFQDAF